MLGTVVTALFGGWDAALKILVFLMIVDYVTGFLAAYKYKRVNSDVMFWGGIRKGVVFIVVIIAVLLDELINGGLPIVRTLALYYYIAREGLSVAENLGLLNVPMPQQMIDALTQLQGEKEPRTVDTIIETAATQEEQVTPISSEVSIAEVKSDVHHDENQKEAK
ncbi:phage holin family protein [Exiguobacterium acetylicum]|uniref:phage holin family protein n=1 Tax=Exiguobacterium acetylicum TaxID=41170 RepID=UPI001EE37D5A|nr:phage holin family protein [Exiguobacterium acetylicum]